MCIPAPTGTGTGTGAGTGGPGTPFLAPLWKMAILNLEFAYLIGVHNGTRLCIRTIGQLHGVQVYSGKDPVAKPTPFPPDPLIQL